MCGRAILRSRSRRSDMPRRVHDASVRGFSTIALTRVGTAYVRAYLQAHMRACSYAQKGKG
eukprot:13520881-Alexandrium_andersonii.AAC.1